MKRITFSDNPLAFSTSWLLPPAALAALRGLLSLYIFVTIIFIWAWYGAHGESSAIGETFSYFTWLTYFGLGFYFLVAALHSAYYARTGRSLFTRWPRALLALHSLFYSTVTTFPFLVTIVYWGAIYSPPWFTEKFEAWANISQHGFNSLFALLEIGLATTPPHPLINLPFLVLILLLYLALAYLTYHDEGWYPYSFLDIKTNGSGLVTGYCFGILAAILVIFAISCALIWLRRKLTKEVVKRSARDVSDRGEENLEAGQEKSYF
ncbi:hypothetical protein ASPZODRAFT_94944 [Penicilliopsis zonata CBS 506.65]|uniref:FAR-17a/AIG1-like protein n=1 Tax=Penicilliopsis zonata CBS 506.65 TaxID=1073090 RepID=A0A1L9SL58_9EURO|nr:hypothetical protein ASPZODRAFT_94944 [Penicilliopsis zonata CBS 506.65]OJJ47925.1 hypothetical protein ASPZODRAFT_94944 [Penicilliopsis zonata CBS 506.65]